MHGLVSWFYMALHGSLLHGSITRFCFTVLFRARYDCDMIALAALERLKDDCPNLNGQLRESAENSDFESNLMDGSIRADLDDSWHCEFFGELI